MFRTDTPTTNDEADPIEAARLRMLARHASAATTPAAATPARADEDDPIEAARLRMVERNRAASR